MSNLGNKEVLSKNLSHYLSQSGRDQRVVAEDLGVAPSTFNEWVKGKKYPRIDKIQMLAEYFGIKMSDLIEEAGEEGYNPGEPKLTEVQKRVVELLSRFPEDAQESALDVLEAVLKAQRKL